MLVEIKTPILPDPFFKEMLNVTDSDTNRPLRWYICVMITVSSVNYPDIIPQVYAVRTPRQPRAHKREPGKSISSPPKELRKSLYNVPPRSQPDISYQLATFSLLACLPA